MPEKPIIFSIQMVQAILNGRKTQTRRICKPAEENALSYVVYAGANNFGDEEGDIQFSAPYSLGDTLWIKETWMIKSWYQDDGAFDIEYLSDGSILNIDLPSEIDPKGDIFNKLWEQSCDDYDKSGVEYDICKDRYITPEFNPCRKRPSIFMPKWAARIWLKVTDIGVQRLQDISEQDAINEGIEKDSITEGYRVYPAKGMWTTDSVLSFQTLWDSINGKDKSKVWEANPWVWVYTFERIEK